MPYSKPNDDSVLPDTGNRVLKTIDRGGGTFEMEYTVGDTDGNPHTAEGVANATIASWIVNAYNNPGTSAVIDQIKVDHPTWNPTTHLVPSRKALFAAMDEGILGFVNTP